MAKAGINRMRSAIIDAYPGPKWESRVNAMPENQVIAIYNHFLRDGVFTKLHQPRTKTNNDCRQFTLEDYGIDLKRNTYEAKHQCLKLDLGKAYNVYSKIINDDYDYLADSVHGVYYDD